MPGIQNLKAATLIGSAAFSLSVTYRGYHCQSSCLISLLNPCLLIAYTGYLKATEKSMAKINNSSGFILKVIQNNFRYTGYNFPSKKIDNCLKTED
jgi:hypothetical protein